MHIYQHHILKTSYRHTQQYKNASPIIETIGERLISRMAYFRLPPQSICDLGCGQGIDSQLLSHVYPGAEIVGVDFSLAQLKKFSSNTDRCVADANQLPFAANQFELVFANLFMPAIIDYPTLWQEIIRVLKPGGIFLFSTLGPESLRELRESMEKHGMKDSINVFPDLHNLGDGLVKAGFKDPAVDAELIELHYSDLKKLLTELKTIGSIKIWDAYSHLYPGKNFWPQVEKYYQQNFSSPQKKLVASLEVYFGIAFAPQQIAENAETTSVAISSIKRRV